MSVPGPLHAVCVDAVARFLDPELQALVSRARETLLTAARDAADPDDEDRLISAMEEVEALAPVAARRFRDSALASLRSPGAAAESAREDVTGLSLVDTARVDDWLRLRKLLAQHPEPARDAEALLLQRLAGVLGEAPRPEDVPVTLAGACALFQAAMQGLGAGRDARGAIYDAFEQTVVAGLDALGARLRGLLAAGVPAAGEAPVPAGARAPAAQPAARPAAAAEEAGPPPALLRGSGELEDPVRMLGALGALRRRLDVPAQRSPDTGAGALEAALAGALAPPGVALDAGERRTVAAMARLMQSALEHPELDADLRARMTRLGPPFALLLLHADEQLALEIDGARHDPVTGLLDRGAFRSRLEPLVQAASVPAVCLVDVDGFGAITRRAGPQVGARLLRALGTLLRRHAGDAGRAARLRGDEFAVMLPAAADGAGRRFAQRYLDAVANARFAIEAEELALTVSIGVVEARGAPSTVGELMRAADGARRAAKAAGGACVRVHGANPPA